ADDHLRRRLDDATANAREHAANLRIAGVLDDGAAGAVVLEVELAFAADLSLWPLALDMHREAVRAILIGDANLAVVLALDHRDTHRHRRDVLVRANFLEFLATGQGAFQHLRVEHGIVDILAGRVDRVFTGNLHEIVSPVSWPVCRYASRSRRFG